MVGENAGNEILFYQTEDGQTRLEVGFGQETVWLSLSQMAELFQRDKSVVSRHIKNVFEEAELQRESVVAEFAITAADGKTYQVEHFNLDVIISVGYRVKSHRGTQFRRWATQQLREFLEKGFLLNDQRSSILLRPCQTPPCLPLLFASQQGFPHFTRKLSD